MEWLFDFVMTVIYVCWCFFGLYMLCIALLCLSDSKECYQCGERLGSHNAKKYRVSGNKGFCGSHCRDIYYRDLQ